MNTVTSKNLSAVMEFGSVIRVNPDLSVDVRPRLDPRRREPEEMLVGTLDADGYLLPGFSEEILTGLPEGWAPMRGYTGQYGAGPDSFLMHESEFIGGGMARYILETPGLYVSIIVDGMLDEPDAETESVGWMVAKADLPAGEVFASGVAEVDESDDEVTSHEFTVETRADGKVAVGINLTDVGQVTYTELDSWEAAEAFLSKSFQTVIYAERA